jgi:hypothetical protein
LISEHVSNFDHFSPEQQEMFKEIAANGMTDIYKDNRWFMKTEKEVGEMA